MTITRLKKVYEFCGVKLSAPNENMTIDQIRDLYATQFPEIATATVTGPEAVGDKLVYRLSRSIGSKG